MVIEIPEAATAGAAREAVARALAIGAAAVRTLVANAVLATEDTLLADDAQLPSDVRSFALLPPVCGG